MHCCKLAFTIGGQLASAQPTIYCFTFDSFYGCCILYIVPWQTLLEFVVSEQFCIFTFFFIAVCNAYQTHIAVSNLFYFTIYEPCGS